jgi:NAD(P)-dependent dehydrogenase (short-subunit alcohol dehydrogenase family)
VNRDGSPHSLATYRKVIDINLIGTFNLMRIGAAAVARTEPVDSDGQRGVVINTASIAGIEGQTGQIAYSASKGGIIGMTVPAARDLSVIGVRVNTICPGIIDTPSTEPGRPARSSRPGSRRRWCSPSAWALRRSMPAWSARSSTTTT